VKFAVLTIYCETTKPKEKDRIAMNVTKNKRKIISVLTVVLGFSFLLMTGTAFAQKVTIDYDRNADFSKYRTYAFGQGTPAPETLTNQRIQEAIESQLAAKGLTRVESNPDLIVVYHCAVDKETQLNTTYLGGWGWGRGWWRWGGGLGDAITRVEKIPVGHLIVDIVDPAEQRYIWQGTSSKTVSSNPEKNAKTIEKGVRKMFEKFPPPPEKK
jgi:hypothetical protein